MKKIFISTIVFFIIFSTSSITCVYAADDDWVSKAFSAASTFMNENATDFKGVLSSPFEFFKNTVKAINRVLIVLLAGISTIALSVPGVRYLASGASPEQRDIAKQSLHTIFIGMAIGFGAFVIWKIAMGIVSIMISSFGSAG